MATLLYYNSSYNVVLERERGSEKDKKSILRVNKLYKCGGGKKKEEIDGLLSIA